MSVRRIKNHGRWVWQARVGYRGRRRPAFRASKDEARQAEAELLAALRGEAERAAVEAAAPVTLRQLFEFYVADLEARGKGTDTLVRAAQTAHVVERLMPALLDRPVSTITEADIFAFRTLRAPAGSIVYDLVDGERKPRAVPTKASTINRGSPHAPRDVQARDA
jgi:hypothetical protein